MIRSILRLPVEPGAEADFEQAFARLQVLAKAAEAAGMRAGELLRPMPVTSGAVLHDSTVYLVTATWVRPGDYQRWLESPVRAALSEQLARSVAPGGVGELYAVIEQF